MITQTSFRRWGAAAQGLLLGAALIAGGYATHLVAVTSAGVLFLLLGALCLRSRIVVRGDGVLLVGLIRRRFLAWPDVNWVDLTHKPMIGWRVRLWTNGRYRYSFAEGSRSTPFVDIECTTPPLDAPDQIVDIYLEIAHHVHRRRNAQRAALAPWPAAWGARQPWHPLRSRIAPPRLPTAAPATERDETTTET